MRLLVDRCVGAVLVVDERPAIVTEQTLLRALAEATSRDTPIGEIASDRPLTVSHGAFVRDAAELMVVEAVQQLAVIDDDRRVLGILPASRVLEALLQGVDPGAWAIMRRLARS